jgi:hypothetical protein
VWRRDPEPHLVDGRAAHRQPTLVKELLVNPRIRWGQAPAGWETPGWAPLVDPGSLPFQPAHLVGRWLWFTAAVGGFLTVTAFMLAHDDPSPGLSLRGVLTVALAAAVVILLTIRRTAGSGPLTRALFEYAVVFVLAVLVATTGVPVDQAPAAGGQTASAARDQRPALVKTIDSVRDWLSEWRTWARKETDRHAHSAPATPGLSPATRRPL